MQEKEEKNTRNVKELVSDFIESRKMSGVCKFEGRLLINKLESK